MPDQSHVVPASAAASPAHGLPRLGERDLVVVTDAVLAVAPEWSVDLCGTDGPDRCVLVMPEAADDMAGPTFIIHAANGAIRLDELRFDTIKPLAERPDLPEIVAILRARLASLSLLTLPATTLRH